ncbi:MAG: SIMPL domain-containing protein [Patescibacteria group bacterium]
MDTMNTSLWTSSRIEKLVALLLLVGSIFVALLAIGAVRNLWEAPPMIGNTITVEGQGRTTAIPNIATISFTVTGEGTNASQAQDAATKKINVAIDLLKKEGLEDEDVKTTSYNLSPKYSYPQPCYGGVPCAYDEQRVVGYTVNQSVEVKVRDTGAVGDLMTVLGDAGISQLYGPNFTVEDMDTVMAEARRLAIEEAKEKADVLADDLDVSLVRIVSFYENQGGYPPVYYSKDMAMGGAVAESRPAPSVPAGENEIVVSVSITYEIR